MLHLLWIGNKNILAIDHHFLKLTGNIINKQLTLLNYKIVSSLNLRPLFYNNISKLNIHF